jgi:hypothetical protein
MYEVKEPFWQFIDHWQTLIAGLLALAAGVGAVWATIKSANREIAAAQEQTKAAQRQTAVTREIERCRISREGYAFHAMLEAAMEAVIEDVEAARNLPSPGPLAAGIALSPSHGPDAYSVQAYAVRQRVKRTGFTELRSAFLHFGGPLTAQFCNSTRKPRFSRNSLLRLMRRPVLRHCSVSMPDCRNILTASSSKQSSCATKPLLE